MADGRPQGGTRPGDPGGALPAPAAPPAALHAALRQGMGVALPVEGEPWTQDDMVALRETLGDQAAATDSLERRATLLISPTAFVLGLGINNAQRVAGNLVAGVLYYLGLVVLIASVGIGGLVLWPRRPLNDPTLSPPRHRCAEIGIAMPPMLEAARRNFRGFHLKTLGLRLQVISLVLGAGAIVAALGYLR